MDKSLTPGIAPLKTRPKRATRTRQIFAILTSLFLFISLVFLVLVEIGNTEKRPVLRKIYFFNLDLSDIVPTSIPNGPLINTIARSLGLHDFYQVGLWNYCKGYDNEGITSCSDPKTLYWFNPIEIILSELLAGATLALPADLLNVLDLVKTASRWMFGLFLLGACLETVMIFAAPLSIFTRWAALPIAVITFIAAVATTAASIVATVMFSLMRDALTSIPELNIRASVGLEMFIFMWIASVFAICAWLIQTALCCCCTSRRDVKKGKKVGKQERTG